MAETMNSFMQKVSIHLKKNELCKKLEKKKRKPFTLKLFRMKKMRNEFEQRKGSNEKYQSF